MNGKIKEELKEALKDNAALDQIGSKKQSIPKSIFIILAIAFIVILLGTYLLNPYAKDSGPYGEIISPIAGTEIGNIVKIVGETKNIESGQYIWLAVDKPGIGSCWPKKYVPGNTKFSTSILEEGPKGVFTLSLYILNENFHKQWKEWQGKKIFGGVHLPSESKRLDSAKLILGD